MSDFQALFIFIGAALTIAWGIALLVGVWKIREALVDEDFPLVDLKEAGRPFRMRVVRVRGRYGATYQRPDSDPVTIEPMFKSHEAVAAHVRQAVAAS